jgi:hypothetical protein
MGSQQDIMNDYALQELKRIYSTYDGWKMSPVKPCGGYNTCVRLDRLNGGHHDIAKVLITFSKEIPATLIEDLVKKDAMTDGLPTRYESAVIAPVNADTSALPAGIRVYPMSSFEFAGNELIWTKKKMSKTPVPLAVKKAE